MSSIILCSVFAAIIWSVFLFIKGYVHYYKETILEIQTKNKKLNENIIELGKSRLDETNERKRIVKEKEITVKELDELSDKYIELTQINEQYFSQLQMLYGIITDMIHTTDVNNKKLEFVYCQKKNGNALCCMYVMDNKNDNDNVMILPNSEFSKESSVSKITKLHQYLEKIGYYSKEQSTKDVHVLQYPYVTTKSEALLMTKGYNGNHKTIAMENIETTLKNKKNIQLIKFKNKLDDEKNNSLEKKILNLLIQEKKDIDDFLKTNIFIVENQKYDEPLTSEYLENSTVCIDNVENIKMLQSWIDNNEKKTINLGLKKNDGINLKLEELNLTKNDMGNIREWIVDNNSSFKYLFMKM
tara:strand:- start:648 stop:1718 length:1071 start_codon:yes stop_codon:yes gene_type:complete